MNNNNDGIVMNGDGPMMQGTWFNPQTGDAFTVKESYFLNNELVVETMDGRRLNYNQTKDYVQQQLRPGEKPIVTKPQPKQAQKNNNEELPPEVADLLDDDKRALGNFANQIPTTPRPEFVKPNPVAIGNLNKPKESDLNIMIISKALKDKAMPGLNVEIDWKDIPFNEMKLLVDILKVKPEDIIDWYLDSIDVNSLLAEAKVKMATRLNNVLNGQPENSIILETGGQPGGQPGITYPITDSTG